MGKGELSAEELLRLANSASGKDPNALLGAVVWASLKIKRHTPVQLLLGSIIPVAAMFISARIIGVWPF